jgi:hypothetical protein
MNIRAFRNDRQNALVNIWLFVSAHVFIIRKRVNELLTIKIPPSWVVIILFSPVDFYAIYVVPIRLLLAEKQCR